MGRHIPIDFKIQLSLHEETQITKEVSSRLSLLSSNPPTVKYSYLDIGKEIGIQIQENSEKDLPPKELSLQIEQQLAKHSPEDYCLRQILKMCHYISVVRNQEILSMKADFYVDMND